MHRELSTRVDRDPGAEPPRLEQRVPKAPTQASMVALRRWPGEKRPQTVELAPWDNWGCICHVSRRRYGHVLGVAPIRKKIVSR